MNQLSPIQAEPFVSDPEDVARRWLEHAKGSTERATMYRRWAAGSRTQAERTKWEAEAERSDNQAAFAMAKHAEWLEA